MINIDWLSYGVETEHTASANSNTEKKFKVENDHIYFSEHPKFSMGVINFIACCYNADKIPVSLESDTDELLIGDDSGYQVYMSKTIDHDYGDQEQIGITLRDHGKWYSWIRFTMSDLLAIVEAITNVTPPEVTTMAKAITPKSQATPKDEIGRAHV